VLKPSVTQSTFNYTRSPIIAEALHIEKPIDTPRDD